MELESQVIVWNGLKSQPLLESCLDLNSAAIGGPPIMVGLRYVIENYVIFERGNDLPDVSDQTTINGESAVWKSRL